MKREELIKFINELDDWSYGYCNTAEEVADSYLSTLPDDNSHFLDDIRKEDDRGYFPNKSLPDVEGCTYPNRIDRFNACDMVYNKCCDCDYHKSNLTNHENREAKNP